MAISKIIGSGLGTINSPVEFTSTATIAGNVIATSGLTVAGLPITGQSTAGRNMVINGAMNVAQRSASVTGIGGNAESYHTVDRIKIGAEGTTAGRLTMTQTADGPVGISANCMKFACTTADTSIAAAELVGISTSLEGQNVQRLSKGVSGAKASTISFYVKGNAAATYACELFDADNSRHIVKLFAVTTSWNRIEFSIPADEDDGSSALDDDNAASLTINFWIHGGSNFTSGTLATAWANKVNANRAAGISSFFDADTRTLFITGLQFEVGPVATEFEQEDFGVTLAKCQRYFFKVEGANGDKVGFGGYAVGASEARFDFVMPVSMRAIPTLSGSGNAQFDAAADSADFAITDMVIDGAPTGIVSGVGLQIASGSMTAGQAGGFRFRSAGTLTLSAEL